MNVRWLAPFSALEILVGAHPVHSQISSRTERIMLGGPTVIAFFAVTQAELDADSAGGGIATALDDLQWYLPKVVPVLGAHGITFVDSNNDTLQLVFRSGPARRFVARDSVRVGFILWRPAHDIQVYWGVMTDMDLICASREYFGWARDSLTASCR